MERKHLTLMAPGLSLILILLISTNASAEVIIINETKPTFYALEDMLIEGDLDTNILTLSGSGQVITGENVKVHMLGRASDILIDNMRVNGLEVPVSFDKKGYYMVLPGEGEFAFQGDLTVRTRGQVRLYAPGPINELRFDLENGYAIHGDQYGLYGRDIIVQRADKVAMLVDGGFRYSYAERNTFLYQIKYRSFGSSLGQAVLNLRSGESVVSVTGVNDYSRQGNRLILELEGEEAYVTVRGTYTSNSLRIPLDEGRHHVLIESDPEKKITISTSAEEIDLSESSVNPTYSNARAFLASKDNTFTVAVKTLEKYPSLAASVSRATNKIAVTAKGSMLAELTYSYSNTGMDYVGVTAPGRPLYAATGYRNPVKLTKEDDKLYLALPKTQSGNLDMIYFDSRESLKPLDKIELPVANTDLIVTQADTYAILPKDYIVLWTYSNYKGGGRGELPSLETALVFALIFAGLGYMMVKKPGFAILYLIYSAGLYYFSWIVLSISLLASIFYVIKRHIDEKSVKWMLAGAGLLAALVIAVIVFFGIWQLGIFSMGGASVRPEVMVQADYSMVDEAVAPMAKSMEVLGRGEAAISVPTREGVLPVRLELPTLGKTVKVTSHLVNREEPLKVSILVVASWVEYMLYVISLLAGIHCLKSLRAVKG